MTMTPASLFPTLTPKEIEMLTGKMTPTPTSITPPTSGIGSITAGRLPPWTTYPKPRKAIVGDLVQEGYWVKATGSRVTKDGWSESSDWNYVVYDPEKKLLDKLSHDVKWSQDGSGNGTVGVDFFSFKQGETNLILVWTEQTWKNYIIATNLIRAMNCKTKKERVEVFDSVFGRDKNSKAVSFEDPF